MSSVTAKVAGPTPTSGFASAATSRVGDVRASASTQNFAPVSELSASIGAGPQDRQVRQDDLNGRYDRSRNNRSPDQRSSDGVRFGNVLATNDFTQVMFELQSREAEVPAPQTRRTSRVGTGSYEFAAQAIHARATGERPTGNTVNRLY